MLRGSRRTLAGKADLLANQKEEMLDSLSQSFIVGVLPDMVFQDNL